VSHAVATYQPRIHGMSAAFTVAAIFDVCVLLVILLTSRARPAQPAATQEAPAASQPVSTPR
jgi:hypothetical protein